MDDLYPQRLESLLPRHSVQTNMIDEDHGDTNGHRMVTNECHCTFFFANISLAGKFLKFEIVPMTPDEETSFALTQFEF